MKGGTSGRSLKTETTLPPATAWIGAPYPNQSVFCVPARAGKRPWTVRIESHAKISGGAKVPFGGKSGERWLTEGSQHPLAESQPPPRSGGAILIGTRRATCRSGPRTVLLPMIASRGDPGANVYVIR